MRLFYPSSTTGSDGISIKTTKVAANNLDIHLANTKHRDWENNKFVEDNKTASA